MNEYGLKHIIYRCMKNNAKYIVLSAVGLATLLSFAVLAHPALAASRYFRAPIVSNAWRGNTYRYAPNMPIRRGGTSSSETVTAAGYVTALNGSTFTMVANAGPSAYVNTAAAAITGRDGAALSASYIAVNDQVTVTGTVSGSTVMASRIVDRTASQYSYNGYNNPPQNNSSATSNGSVSLSLSPYVSTLSAGQSTTITANAYDADGIANVNIYVNGSLAQSCPLSYYPASGTCALTLYGSNYAYGSNITVYAQTTDRYGNIATSSTSSITTQNNTTGNSNGSVTVSLSPYAITLTGNQTTYITTNSSDTDGITTTSIYVNGSLVQSCPVSNYPTSSICSSSIYGGNYAYGSNITVYAQTSDRYGNIATSATSTIAKW